MFIEYISTVIRLLSDSLNLIGCRGNVKSEFSKKACFSKLFVNAINMYVIFNLLILVVLFIAVLLQKF